MAIELLGGRILAPYFGSSIYVWGSLITIFMLALSIGYLLGGRLSLNRPSVRRLGLLFLFAAACVIPIALFSDILLDLIFEFIDDPRYGSLLGSVVLFMAPTILLGMVSPYAVRLMVRSTEQSGEVAGRLYFVSTMGSAIGTLLTSFYLVLYFEVNQILRAIMLILIVSGLAAVLHRPAGNKS